MRGAIATGSHQSAKAASEVLRAGGNAVDAALAAMMTSFSSEMISTGPGSGGLAAVRERNGRVRLFNFFSAAPGLGLEDDGLRAPMDFREKKITFGKAHLSFHIGRASSAVPGVLRGIDHLHRHYATMPLAELAVPGIAAARFGVKLNPMQLLIGRSLEPILGDDPALYAMVGGKEHYLADNRPIVMAPLGDLLERFVAEGPDSFYNGDAAAAIVADQRERGGLITRRDLAEYRVIEQDPFGTAGAHWDLVSHGPPALGGTMIVLLLTFWKRLEAEFGPCALNSTDYRLRWCVLLDMINTQRALIETIRDVRDHQDFIDRLVEKHHAECADAVRERRPLRPSATRRLPGSTAHLSVIDESGLGVAITSSPGESAGYMVPGLGMIMNNMMGEDDLHPHGFHRMPAGDRLPTMMAPSVMRRRGPGGDDIFLFGSGGSVRIRSALSQFVHLCGERGMGMREAIDWPRVHFEEGRMQLEAETDRDRISALEGMGFDVVAWDSCTAFFGGINGVCLRADGSLEAYGDPRRAGAGVVVT